MPRRRRRAERHPDNQQSTPMPWAKDADGFTCWYSDEDCPECGGMQATNGRDTWCVTCSHFEED